MLRRLTVLMAISFVAVNAIFLAAVTFMSYHVFFDYTTDEISSARLLVLNESAGSVSSLLTGVSEAGVYIAANRGLIETLSDRPDSTYAAIVERRQLIDLVEGVANFRRAVHSIEIFVDRYSDLPLDPAGGVYPTTTITGERWYPAFESMDTGWIPRHVSPTDGVEVFSYLHRLMNARGRTVGHVKVNVAAETLIDSMTGGSRYSDGEDLILLVDARGRVVGRGGGGEATERALEGITEPSASGAYRMLASGFRGSGPSSEMVRSGDHLYLSLVSEATYERWRLLQLIPIDRLHADAGRLGLLALIMGLVGLLLSIPIVYLVGRRLIVPIERLIEGMNSVERSDFRVQLPRYFIREYDELSIHFNRMVAELDSAVRRLEDEHYARREAELKSLQDQIMPHFLYNTLDLIHWKATDIGARDISTMVSELGRMFRIGLSRGKKLIPLRDEIAHVTGYLNIQRSRNDHYFSFTVDVPASIKSLLVPKIILQPFVENSLSHGLDAARGSPLHIYIDAAVRETRNGEGTRDEAPHLEIVIGDDGSGLPAGWRGDLCEGIGIRNVKERIEMFCGSPYGCTISNGWSGGVEVRIVLPVMKESPRE